MENVISIKAYKDGANRLHLVIDNCTMTCEEAILKMFSVLPSAQDKVVGLEEPQIDTSIPMPLNEEPILPPLSEVGTEEIPTIENTAVAVDDTVAVTDKTETVEDDTDASNEAAVLYTMKDGSQRKAIPTYGQYACDDVSEIYSKYRTCGVLEYLIGITPKFTADAEREVVLEMIKKGFGFFVPDRMNETDIKFFLRCYAKQFKDTDIRQLIGREYSDLNSYLTTNPIEEQRLLIKSLQEKIK